MTRTMETNDTTVKPVLSSTILSGHPLLSDQFSMSQKLLPLITVMMTSIKQSPLLSGCSHNLRNPNATSSVVLICI